MTKLSRFIDHYLIYVCLILLTLVVLRQITLLKENDEKTNRIIAELKTAQKKIDQAQERINNMLKKDVADHEQTVALLKLLRIEQKESKLLKDLIVGCK